MCRLLVFKGTEPIQISHLVTKPAHSIITQAFDARLRLDATRSVNGDGFGVGWYDADLASSCSSSEEQQQHKEREGGEDGSHQRTREASCASCGHLHMQRDAASPLRAVAPSDEKEAPITPHNHPHAPCIFTSVTPAWNNANLHRLAEKIRSPLIFAHVRASTAGALSETNCHPWRFGRLMWMHNGQISSFGKMKRRVVTEALVEEELFLFPQGHTDSEYAFCVFLHHLLQILREEEQHRHEQEGSSGGEGVDAGSSGVELLLQKEAFAWRDLRDALLRTIESFNTWSKEVAASEPSLMNFVVSDGETVVCSRYINSRTDEAASLYFSSGTSFYEDAPGQYRMVKADKREKIIVVASEPLTFEKADWIQIPTNTLVTITPRMNLLQQPILDEFASPTVDEASQRTPHFAIKSGYQPNVPVGHGHAARERSAGQSSHHARRDLSSSSSSADGGLDDVPTAPAREGRTLPSGSAPQPLAPVQMNAAASDGSRAGVTGRVSTAAADALVSRLKARDTGRRPRGSAAPVNAGNGQSAASAEQPAMPPPPADVATADDAERKPLPFLRPSGQIRVVDRSHPAFTRPSKRIVSAGALKRFERSETFDEILSFVSVLNDAVALKRLRDPSIHDSEPVAALRSLISRIDALVDETPADKSTGSRFGNAAFRSFYSKVKAAMPALHAGVPGLPAGAEVELSTYLEESWGNEKRIDYGSGMELNFACWLLCLAKLGVVDVQRDAPALVLHVFWDYITVMRKIQSTYWLEPAGSHGVWGLDDYHFLPFLWGAGQLKDHKHLKPKAIHDPEMLEEFSADYMYFACIRFINSIKTASLRWHSPMLDDISGVKTWAKVNEGMQKMYRGEVLLKLPIAQHIFFGSLLAFPELQPGEADEEDAAAEEDEHGHIHHKHGTGEGQAAGWGDCCGIPIPSAFAAAEAEKAGAKTNSAYAQGMRSAQSSIRRIPFD